jgi:glycosyltransferase involved in cell wall biosynthesis
VHSVTSIPLSKGNRSAFAHDVLVMTAGLDVLLARSSAIAPEPRLERAASMLAEMGFSVLILGWDREGRQPKTQEAERGVRIRRVYAPGGYGRGLGNIPGLVLFNLALLHACARLKPRVVHAVDLDTALPALLSKRLFGSRFLYDIADWYSASRLRFARHKHFLKQLLDRLENWVARQADYVVLPDESRMAYLTARPSRCAIVYNTPEDCRTEALQTGVWAPYKPYVAYAGRLDQDRGIKEAILAADGAGIYLLLAGSGPLASDCAAAAQRARFVRYLGLLEYRRALALQEGAIAVLATYDPSVEINRLAAPYKLYEALMLGKPVIASIGTLPGRLVQEEGVGLAVTYGSVEELAGAFRYLVQNPTEAGKMGMRARGLYEERYSWARQRQKLQDIYIGLTRGDAQERTS